MKKLLLLLLLPLLLISCEKDDDIIIKQENIINPTVKEIDTIDDYSDITSLLNELKNKTKE